MKRKIELIDGINYRPDKILVDVEEYSMTEYKKYHRYNWQSTASGNILFYRSADGKEIEVKQSYLFSLK